MSSNSLGSLMRTAVIVGLGIFLLSAGGLFWFLRAGDEGRDVIIPRRTNLAQVAEILGSNGIISHPTAFKLLMRFTGGAHKVRAGEFHFQRRMGMLGALRIVYYGEPILHPLTVPEGWTVRQIAQAVAKAQLGNEQKFLSLTLNRAAAAKYHLNAPSLEGYLYPDTYKISKIDGEDRIVDMMVHRFQTVLDPAMRARAAALGMTIEQVVTLASIIEKETGTLDDPKLIASVFHNRLRVHMSLDSDPTTIYGIPNFNGNLTKRDLRTPTPYNTYTIHGLPPGAIASPGLRSLQAALNPAQTNYLYFVSNNQGKSLFSATLKEHNQRVQHWQVDYFRAQKANRQIGKVDRK